MRAHLVGRIGNLGHAGDIVGQPLVVGLGFAQALRRGESELRVALGSHAIPSFRVCLSSRPLIRVPNDFVRSAPSSERSRSPARSPQTVRTKTTAGGARVEPNKARCRFHGGSLAEVNLRLTPLMCAILLRDDFTQV